jgi:hypothetical protein
MTTYLDSFVSFLESWAQRLGMVVSLALAPSSTYVPCYVTVQAPAMLVASDLRGKATFFVPEI